MTFTINCSGPGPHVPADGVLGTSTVQIAGARCGSTACQIAPDPAIATVLDLTAKARTALTSLATFEASVAARRTAIASDKTTATAMQTATVTTIAQAQTQIRSIGLLLTHVATALDDLNNESEANAKQLTAIIKLLMGEVLGATDLLQDSTGT